jgi:hypothetical protein
MARVLELGEMLIDPPEISTEEMETHLGLVGQEAVFVERLAGELKVGCLRSTELPALLENLAARLAKLANPASPWRGIGGRQCEGSTIVDTAERR